MVLFLYQALQKGFIVIHYNQALLQKLPALFLYTYQYSSQYTSIVRCILNTLHVSAYA